MERRDAELLRPPVAVPGPAGAAVERALARAIVSLCVHVSLLSRLEFQGAHTALRIGRAELAGCYEKRATVPVVNWGRSAMAVVPCGRGGQGAHLTKGGARSRIDLESPRQPGHTGRVPLAKFAATILEDI